MWQRFLEKFLSCREKYVPKRKANKRKRQPGWMSKGIEKLIRKRNRYWERFRKWPTFKAEMEYKRARNRVTSAIRRAKEKFEHTLAEKIKEDPKSFYGYVRTQSKTKVKVGPLENRQGSIVGDNKGMSVILSEYFSTVFTDENLDRLPIPSERGKEGKKVCIDWIEVTEEKVELAIRSLKGNKTAGVDGIVEFCNEKHGWYSGTAEKDI